MSLGVRPPPKGYTMKDIQTLSLKVKALERRIINEKEGTILHLKNGKPV